MKPPDDPEARVRMMCALLDIRISKQHSPVGNGRILYLESQSGYFGSTGFTSMWAAGWNHAKHLLDEHVIGNANDRS